MNLSNGTLDPAIEAKNTHTYLISVSEVDTNNFLVPVIFVVSTSIGISQYIPFSPLRNT